MDEAMKKLLSDYLAKLLSAAEAGVEWTASQIPLIIQEKLAWEFWIHIVYGSVWAVILFSCLYILFLSISKFNKSDYGGGDGWIGGMVGSVIVGLIAIIAVFTNLEHVIQISVAPRLYIIEWLRAGIK